MYFVKFDPRLIYVLYFQEEVSTMSTPTFAAKDK